METHIKWVNKFNESRRETWAELQQDEARRPTETICIFCYAHFQDNEQVLQLKCHRNHVFHRNCFQRHLAQERTRVLDENL